MPDLYNKVKRIVEANTKEEAKNLLYGREGIQINSTEYYQNIISNFIRKKDIVLPKDSNGNIIYDIDENIQDIWDIVFISQYIQEQWKKEKKELEREKINLNRKIKLEKNSIILEQLIDKKKEIIKLEGMINQYFQHLEKISELNKINIQTNMYIDKNKYKNELLELKKAIKIIQKIRDSFEHKNNKLKIDKTVTIDNEKNKFKITIPIEYLDGFTKGRIIVEEEDKYLIEKTNNITYPLLEELDYNPQKIESFFYKVEPRLLEFLLDFFSNDIKSIYELNYWYFSNYETTIKVLTYFKNYGFNNNKIKKLDGMIFQEFEKCIAFINELKKENLDKKIIEEITFKHMYYCFIANPKEGKKLIKQIIKEGYSLDLLTNLDILYPEEIFDAENIMKAIKIKEELGNLNDNRSGLLIGFYRNPEGLRKVTDYLKEHNYSMKYLEIMGTKSFENPEETIELFEYIRRKGIEEYFNKDDMDAYQLVWNLIDSPKETKKVLEYLEKYDNKIETQLAANIFEFMEENDADGVIKVLDHIQHKEYKLDKSIFWIIHNAKFNYPESIIEIFDFFELEKIDLTLIIWLNEYMFINPKYCKDVLIFLKENELLKKEIICNIKGGNGIFESKPIIEYLRKNYSEEEAIKIFENLSNNGLLWWSSLIIEALEYLKGKGCNAESIIEYCKNDCDFFRLLTINEVLDKAKFEITGVIPRKLAPTRGIINFDNIKYLLKLVNNDITQLDEFPIEFFTCDIDVLEEILSKYNYNLCRSIFGIDNPKIISLLIYMNNVYGSYSKDIAKDISINPINIIENSLNDTYKYKSNITDKDINRNSYVNQFIIDEKEVKNNPNIMQFNYINSGFHKNANGEYFNPNIDEYDDGYNPNNDPLFMPKRNIEQIKEYIIRKLRNSSAHFRFKLVKDKEGNILEDKIYLYDEDNNGNNFNIIMNINDALDITRKVELGIKEFNNNKELNNNRKSK